jgi:hypothetical protein
VESKIVYYESENTDLVNPKNMHPLLPRLALTLLSFFSLTVAAAPDEKLFGCWVNDRVVQSSRQGLPVNRSLRCAFYFDQKTFTSACPNEENPKAYSLISYTYEITASGEYVAKVIRIDDQPNAVGSALKFVYQISDNNLFLLAFPRTAKPVPFSLVVRDESVSLKTPVKTKEDCLFKAVEKSPKSSVM